MLALALIKFGAPEHIERFVEHGEMYFQTIEHFRKLEADELRGDPSEGLSEYYQSALVELIMTADDGRVSKWSGKSGTLTNAVRLSNANVTGLHVFCMYALRPENPPSLYFDPRVFKFGAAYAVIDDWGEFFTRVKAALATQGFKHQRAYVEYVDREIHSGDMGHFRKFREFEYQCEYRIAVGTGLPGPFVMKIGSLRDIATIGVTKDINSVFTIGYNLLTA
jgi:hypothetical protein